MIDPDTLQQIEEQLAKWPTADIPHAWVRSLLAHLAQITEEKEGWRCFHCDEVFTTLGAARDHFGGEGADTGCLIDRVALEEGGTPERGRGLLMALRKAEDRIAELCRELDSTENDARLWHESEGERRRLQKGHDTSWFMFLDALEGERLVLAERVTKAESALAQIMQDRKGYEQEADRLTIEAADLRKTLSRLQDEGATVIAEMRRNAEGAWLLGWADRLSILFQRPHQPEDI